ncbi:MAG: hypothetical protein WCF79_23995 [Rhodomicrobium sp.]|jgi:hypothetical protein
MPAKNCPAYKIDKSTLTLPCQALCEKCGLAEQLRTLGAIPPRIEVELVSALDRSGGRMGKLKLLQITPASAA